MMKTEFFAWGLAFLRCFALVALALAADPLTRKEIALVEGLIKAPS